MSARAGIVVTGTEVLSGIISDRNGPWLSERLREIGVDAAFITIAGDRPQDLDAALRFFAEEGVDLIVTSGGLGPTADDLTAEVVGRFQGREMALDEALFGRIADILKPLLARWPDLDPEAVLRSNRKQAVIPVGATILEPVGTAPGLVVPPASEGPTVVVLPGPPRELQPMWETARGTAAFTAAVQGATTFDWRIMRLFGLPESEIAETLLVAEREGLSLEPLEITTCLRRGEIEIATRFEPADAPAYDALAAFVRARHGQLLFSEDGSTIDEQVAALLTGSSASPARTIATAESCTGGLLAGRLTDRAGSSAYVLGGLVVYANAAKVALAGVAPELIERVGAVSPEVAEALADGAADRLGADVGVGVTGIAGPGGGTPEKPVGLVYVSVALADGGERITRRLNLSGNRADVRDRTTTVALHLIRRLLLGLPDAPDVPGILGTRTRT
ncbi:competence/damage-inducible protein A [Conexibacter woesei]|uniref:CinA-like protein n=1 Tax=Conexibacter woesei (strain DSM 14684 / CCUG 47730 / CIP 108061 / JCM 11494 / NBRC 100937 / ID131577) TaxID=469383 RepID=D3FE46_CONWI|nr:competence/damage-inducible protein A [Conexibacter woesei]ADB51662.1 competence/damage-inducible protein CinA [Conexibacter woesei DSM 14684]